MDAAGHLSDGPIAGEGFTGAVGVEVLPPDATTPQKLLVRHQASGWVTFDALPDPGTVERRLRYLVGTRGVMLRTGGPLLVDVFSGASALGGCPPVGRARVGTAGCVACSFSPRFS